MWGEGRKAGMEGHIDLLLSCFYDLTLGLSFSLRFRRLSLDGIGTLMMGHICLLYTSDAADEEDS
eukprot:572111-Amorphochlora_amoeboformis.AAC.1